jgi:hypothetical protein
LPISRRRRKRAADTLGMAAAAWTACTKLIVLQKKVGPRRELSCSGALLFYGRF